MLVLKSGEQATRAHAKWFSFADGKKYGWLARLGPCFMWAYLLEEVYANMIPRNEQQLENMYTPLHEPRAAEFTDAPQNRTIIRTNLKRACVRLRNAQYYSCMIFNFYGKHTCKINLMITTNHHSYIPILMTRTCTLHVYAHFCRHEKPCTCTCTHSSET